MGLKLNGERRIQITFNEEQYELLIRIFYLGRWVEQANEFPSEFNPERTRTIFI